MKILLDTGHGGYSIKTGYGTPGKRSPAGHSGVLYEGVSNRAFAHDLCLLLTLKGIDCQVVNDSTEDIPLSNRVARINQMILGEDVLLVSIHSNAGPDVVGFSDYKGLECFTTVGDTPADKYAHIIGDHVRTAMPDEVWRWGEKDRKIDKEKNWSILLVKCPAILFEIKFMNGRADYTDLVSMEWRAKFTSVLADGIEKAVKSKK